MYINAYFQNASSRFLCDHMVQPIRTARNREKVDAVVCFGVGNEDTQVRGGLLASRIKAEYIFINAKDKDQPRLPADLKGELARALDGKKNPIVISDTGYTRPEYSILTLAADAKEVAPKSAVVLLTSDQDCVNAPKRMQNYFLGKDLPNFRGAAALEAIQKIDYVYNSGNDLVFEAIVKMHQHRLNYGKDNESVIVVLEDQPSYYTDFVLSLQRISMDRAHILLARDFESASKIVQTAQGRVVGAILDMRFPKGGAEVDFAWREIANLLRETDPKVPIVLQSANDQLMEVARKEGKYFTLSKNDGALYMKLRRIISENFGFGPFIFKAPPPDENEILRADNLTDIVSILRGATRDNLVGASIFYHAANDHFSNWLRMHGNKGLARKVKPIAADAPEQMIEKLLRVFEPHLKVEK